jgi:hypothetical protein
MGNTNSVRECVNSLVESHPNVKIMTHSHVLALKYSSNRVSESNLVKVLAQLLNLAELVCNAGSISLTRLHCSRHKLGKFCSRTVVKVGWGPSQ